MAVKQGTNHKTDRSKNAAHRGIQPGDKVVNRDKKNTRKKPGMALVSGREKPLMERIRIEDTTTKKPSLQEQRQQYLQRQQEERANKARQIEGILELKLIKHPEAFVVVKYLCGHYARQSGPSYAIIANAMKRWRAHSEFSTKATDGQLALGKRAFELELAAH